MNIKEAIEVQEKELKRLENRKETSIFLYRDDIKAYESLCAKIESLKLFIEVAHKVNRATNGITVVDGMDSFSFINHIPKEDYEKYGIQTEKVVWKSER